MQVASKKFINDESTVVQESIVGLGKALADTVDIVY